MLAPVLEYFVNLDETTYLPAEAFGVFGHIAGGCMIILIARHRYLLSNALNGESITEQENTKKWLHVLQFTQLSTVYIVLFLIWLYYVDENPLEEYWLMTKNLSIYLLHGLPTLICVILTLCYYCKSSNNTPMLLPQEEDLILMKILPITFVFFMLIFLGYILMAVTEIFCVRMIWNSMIFISRVLMGSFDCILYIGVSCVHPTLRHSIYELLYVEQE